MKEFEDMKIKYNTGLGNKITNSNLNKFIPINQRIRENQFINENDIDNINNTNTAIDNNKFQPHSNHINNNIQLKSKSDFSQTFDYKKHQDILKNVYNNVVIPIKNEIKPSLIETNYHNKNGIIQKIMNSDETDEKNKENFHFHHENEEKIFNENLFSKNQNFRKTNIKSKIHGESLQKINKDLHRLIKNDEHSLKENLNLKHNKPLIQNINKMNVISNYNYKKLDENVNVNVNVTNKFNNVMNKNNFNYNKNNSNVVQHKYKEITNNKRKKDNRSNKDTNNLSDFY